MSQEGAKALFDRMTSDEEFRLKVEAAPTPDEKHKIVSEAGYEVTPADMPTIKSLGGIEELSDDDLEKVAGGGQTETDLIVGGTGVGLLVVAGAAAAAAV